MLPPLTLPAEAAAAPVCVAFSGGLDSTALLHALAETPGLRAQGLRVLHVHHGLHARADAWTAHCQEVCKALHLELIVHRVEVVQAGDGLEAAARRARYAAIAGTLRKGEVLATAHHRDDQAETFLLRALRASGSEGLGAMRAWRPFAQGWHWRPWLQVPRAQLLAWARARRLAWIEDPSNADTDLDRNFLRHEVFPLLQRRWPHVAASFARAAELAQSAADLLSEDDAHALQDVSQGDPPRLSVQGLRALPAPRRARVLRAWIARCTLPPLPAQGVARVSQDLLDAREDALPHFDWAGARIVRWRGQLYAHRPHGPLSPRWSAQWDGRMPLVLPDGGSLHLDGATAFPATVTVRARQGGERIRLPGREHTHALKHVLQDSGIPPWERPRLPLLFEPGGALLAAGDAVIGDTLQRWLHEHRGQLRWQRD
ncbi:tRNA lysidine(34) synthetase TilS [Pseudoxanthomonas composti]|uniref:tRNA(Ile)-lysidine synthase n=1 Tax=Pseudoxanthomonas composti TaxID=2137479 RepID=A0A4Q1JZ95_9GAMM|nr:tRNA lysidine(34) synthetase TilS [Pseudoxanthomonas composti]RXR08409.1 tRNA lysidine(34) synthetase TilS [Pseudoxanthomonas composti]